MSALEWVWYMPPNIQASSDGHWRIYKGRKYGSSAPTYSLLRVLADGALRCVYHTASADECKTKANEMTEEGDE